MMLSNLIERLTLIYDNVGDMPVHDDFKDRPITSVSLLKDAVPPQVRINLSDD